MIPVSAWQPQASRVVVMCYLFAPERYDSVSLCRPVHTVVEVASPLLLAHRELYLDLS
jgi:hypothetical protein